MKNLKVSVKLISGFCIVAALTIIVGILGVTSLISTDSAYFDGIVENGYPLATMGDALLGLQSACTKLVILLQSDNDEASRTVEASMFGFLEEFELSIEKYRDSVTSADVRQPFEEGIRIYESSVKPEFSNAAANKARLSETEIEALVIAVNATIDGVAEKFAESMDAKLANLDKLNIDNTANSKRTFAIVLIICIISAGIALFLGFYISGIISKPLKTLSAFMKRAGTTGDISLSPEDVKIIQNFSLIKDEVGQTIASSAQFVGHISNSANNLDLIANGDLTVNVDTLSDKDVIGISLSKMVDSLGGMFGEIHTASSQVTTGSDQISSGAQALASGSTQQAATLEEISASINDIASETKENAERTSNASELAETIMRSAEKGTNQMEQMITAVNEINQANQDISKVIKVIDDIAFQTNILALNAAVEAARAGSAGKGFAVVAEEVRNLAAKSAESAKETAALIENSMNKAQLGTQIAGETAASLNEIVSGIGESNTIIGQIAKSSEHQDGAIGQITIAISGVTEVVQQNSATAEESAAASEEMSSQANVLERLITQFKLKN
jgi:methyl-accepting chemotaxis protein